MILVPLDVAPASGNVDIFPGELSLDWSPGELSLGAWSAGELVGNGWSADALSLGGWSAGHLYLEDDIMPLNRPISTLSKEFLYGVETASVTLDAQPVEVAFVSGKNSAPTDTAQWHPAVWQGVAGTTRSWQVKLGDVSATPSTVLTADTYTVWSKITTPDEEPVLKHVETITIV